MPSQIVFQKNLANYLEVNWYSQNVFKRYTQLKNYIHQKLGAEYASIFAEPFISENALGGSGKASWASEVISGNAKPYTELPSDQKSEIKALIDQKLGAISSLGQKLMYSENAEENRWGQLILKALEIPDDGHILVEGDKFILVAWGFVYDKPVDSDAQLSSSIKRTIPTPSIIDRPQKNPDLRIPTNEEKPLESEPVPQESTPLSNPTPSSENGPSEESGENEKRFDSGPEKTPSYQNDKTPQDQKPDPTKIVNPPFWRRWIFWLILIPFLLLLVFLLTQCFRGDRNLLPPQTGVIVPIDTSKLAPDPDNINMIVYDRLNVALTGEKQSVRDFAKLFKQKYPAGEYKIIYYDTTSMKRLQIQIPDSNEREKVRKDLEENFNDFAPLVWYEAIFEKNYTPSDPGFNDPNNSWYHKMVGIYSAWEVTQGDSDMVIAIIDDGFDLNHPEFQGKVYKPRNIPANSPNVVPRPNLVHGTHVAGIAASNQNNGLGVSGIAPNCKIMPVQVADRYGVMSSTSIIDGILYAIHNNATVMNLSLGKRMSPRIAQLPPSVQEQLTRTTHKQEEAFWERLFKLAYDNNTIPVLAAGNDNVMIGLDPMQRSSKTIKVSAVDQRASKARFSNFGYLSTISAPGVSIYSSIPGNQFKYFDGTSMAAPIVTGGIALIKSVNPTMSYEDLVDLIQSTGLPVNSSRGYMGNLIQFDKILKITREGRDQMPVVDCPDVQDKIDSLLLEVEKLKQICEDNTVIEDTLKLPPQLNDFEFAEGRWKSTSYIYNAQTGEKVTIYFDFFRNGTGKITLLEPDNNECVASLSLGINQNSFVLTQLSPAQCNQSRQGYSPYKFTCKADNNGYAECQAQNRSTPQPVFSFKLVKIRRNQLSM